jgi:hypothetical protein
VYALRRGSQTGDGDVRQGSGRMVGAVDARGEDVGVVGELDR